MISVRQASDLPPASFRFPVTQDTLALGYILPAVGRIGDFHPLKHAPAGRTKKRFTAPNGAVNLISIYIRDKKLIILLYQLYFEMSIIIPKKHHLEIYIAEEDLLHDLFPAHRIKLLYLPRAILLISNYIFLQIFSILHSFFLLQSYVYRFMYYDTYQRLSQCFY